MSRPLFETASALSNVIYTSLKRQWRWKQLPSASGCQHRLDFWEITSIMLRIRGALFSSHVSVSASSFAPRESNCERNYHFLIAFNEKNFNLQLANWLHPPDSHSEVFDAFDIFQPGGGNSLIEHILFSITLFMLKDHHVHVHICLF